ncbi:fas-binding factor 1 homolog isoform X2 [Athene cunicularia]|uniref:fas-binding factor 1 homolog isoform X2 n=1 Tax=Athene cunicularia TaxID=194338 RepID=UPI000EF706EF|nr:fas-binding factor 1 homolog isoform X2 [Athene cunicularia]
MVSSPASTPFMCLVSESVDDLLDDLLGYEDDESPVTFTRSFRPARGSSGRARGTSSVANQNDCPGRRVTGDAFGN